jgi:hypothetical protein
LHAPSVQLPLGQLAAAFAKLHVIPHALQFVVVFSVASQPLLARPSQLP